MEPGPAAPVRPLAAFGRTLTRFESAKVVPEVALRNSLGFTLALVTGILFSGPGAGVIAATGALNLAVSDSRDPYAIRGKRMLISSLLTGVAVTAGSLSGHIDAAAVALATFWAFVAGMLLALGTQAGDIGSLSLVTLVVFAARPLPPLQALEAGLVAMGGGLLQTLLSVALWPVRRYEPERRIVSALYSSLANIARTSDSQVTPHGVAPPNSAQFSDAQDALVFLSRDHSPESERLVFLFNQAERIRLSLLTLARLGRRMRRDEHGAGISDLLFVTLHEAAPALDAVADATLTGRAADNVGQDSRLAFKQAADAFLQAPEVVHEEEEAAFFSALVRDARLQLDALGGQLRSSTGVATTPSMMSSEEPWRLRLTERLAKLQANLSLHSTVFRHAVRLAICVGAGEVAGKAITVQRTYWLPMTVALVLKPDFTGTLSRGIQRLTGTFAGLLLATLLFHFIHTGMTTDVFLLVIFVVIMRLIGPANYAILVTALSALIVLLVALTGVAPKEVIAARAINTALGGVLAMIAYFLWPTWERSLIGPALADMMDNYRSYFHAVIDAYSTGDLSSLNSTRVKARRGRSNAEASADRLGAEPGIRQEQVNTLNAILVNSHSFARAVMSIESGLYQTEKTAVREATRQFAGGVDQTLRALAEVFRDATPLPKNLPDLREAHNVMMQTQHERADRYTIIDVETDRIATSLNTVCEQVPKWLALTHQVPR